MQRVPFHMGRIMATPGARDTFQLEEIIDCLNRHGRGDWGDLDEHDTAVNLDALESGARLLSSYKLPYGKLWIITEAEDDAGIRSHTTCLLPEEY